jgi:hypothetical protein
MLNADRGRATDPKCTAFLRCPSTMPLDSVMPYTSISGTPSVRK